MKSTLSVVVSAYNEETTLDRCLESVKNIADEIIVVDNTSSDKTVEIAKKHTKKVFARVNQLMLNTNKNFGFDKATSDWILNLDADEVIPEKLAKEIEMILKSDSPENGFWIKRKNYSFGKWIAHGLWWPDKQIRLFRRGKGLFPCMHIHEYIKIEGTIGELVEPYIHYNYETIHQYLLKIDRTSSSEAIYLSEMKYQFSWFDAIRFPLSDFLKIYFAQEGYKDGLHGLVLALFQAFYSFCTFAKYWEMQKFIPQEISLSQIDTEFRARGKDMRYWILSALLSETGNVAKKIMLKIQRKKYS